MKLLSEELKVRILYSQTEIYKLKQAAECSTRRRAHLNLHRNYNDKIQKLLIALTKNTYIPPHCHKLEHQTEHFQILEGEVVLVIFDRNGDIKDYTLLSPNGITAVEVEPDVFHTVICLTDSAILMEIKLGPFEQSTSKFIPSWSPLESDDEKTNLEYLKSLRGCLSDLY